MKLRRRRSIDSSRRNVHVSAFGRLAQTRIRRVLHLAIAEAQSSKLKNLKLKLCKWSDLAINSQLTILP